jgi:hypothetical protein
MRSDVRAANSALLSRMRPGDTVCVFTNGEPYLGENTGEAEQATLAQGTRCINMHLILISPRRRS